MSTVTEGMDSEQLWGGTVAALLVALVGGVLVFPERVYYGFVWHYFWGPVVADAKSAQCAAYADGSVSFLYESSACAAAPEPVAYPGYTLVSEVGYALTMLLALLGIVFMLRRLEVGRDRGLFYALFPYMLFGGALRVIEDAFDALDPAQAAISFPWNTLIISPVIYFTMFAVTLAALLASVWLRNSGATEGYRYTLAGIGTALLSASVGYLGFLAVTTDYVDFFPQITVVVLVGATLVTWLTWEGLTRYAPEVNEGTGKMGIVVIWAHAVDGVANVVGIDWARELGLPADLVPKHPVNRFLIGVGEQFPEPVVELIGTAWPFLLVKIVAAVFVVWVFDEGIFEESPRYAILLLVAIVAVGLGPGTRDMLRATFGI
ncbi:DUF63 family protein [Halorussus gelatinilyticus]|uniref:DUF63 family protein n=1 Tax=Halorussus gelatinilyticus TaxID=2937524 RepID=A0A8U0IHQ4_9EURY|nr:DUF63 family protein [Halorussus gelatinilyticus]UPW00617.1 DUF63 family protein [Halorussus gelatinilyticus]